MRSASLLSLSTPALELLQAQGIMPPLPRAATPTQAPKPRADNDAARKRPLSQGSSTQANNANKKPRQQAGEQVNGYR